MKIRAFFAILLCKLLRFASRVLHRGGTAMPGRAAFFRCAEGFAYGWWLHTLLDSAAPELAGFTVLLGG